MKDNKTVIKMVENKKFFDEIEKKLGKDDFEKFLIAVVNSNAIMWVENALDFLYEISQTQESVVDTAIIDYLNQNRGFDINEKDKNGRN